MEDIMSAGTPNNNPPIKKAITRMMLAMRPMMAPISAKAQYFLAIANPAPIKGTPGTGARLTSTVSGISVAPLREAGLLTAC